MGTSASTATPPFPITDDATSVLTRLWEAGHAAYLVGGGVRDALLGLPVSDWDVATDARPRRILRLFPGSTYQNRFGTVLAHGLEITTFRRDHRYADHRRPETVTFSRDIFEDLARRDLTINAIAWGGRGRQAEPRFVDPADGRADLRARLVRAVGDPRRRFEEDALRLLRAVRIAARLDFAIEPVTLRAIRARAGDISWVSEERVGSEVRRMLGADRPSRALRLMAETGLLASTLPELAALPEEGIGRALDALDRVHAGDPGNEGLALAALLSELDPATARTVLERLRIPGRDVATITTLIAAAQEAYSSAWRDADVRRYMARVSPAALDDLLVLRTARAGEGVRADELDGVDGTEAEGGAERELRARVAAQRAAAAPLRLADLAIDGHDLQRELGVPQGPVIGDLLRRLLDVVIEEPGLNVRSTLLRRARTMLRERGRGADSGTGRPAIG